MKRFLTALTLLALMTACTVSHKTKESRKVSEYVVVPIETPDLSYISDNGKEVLNLYRFAAGEIDQIYWKQYFGDKAEMDRIQDEATRTYAAINYGPWDRLDGKSFVEGYGERPLGANFYPADMSDEEFSSFSDPDKNSPYTLIRRAEDGSLKTVWFHDEYADNIQKIDSYLRAAADITIVPSVRTYLLKKAEALRSDDYYESDLAWLDMDDSKMDLVIGPNETADDQRFGIKTSYEAFVLLKDLDKTESMRKYITELPDLQNSLPCAPEYKTFEPGLASNIFACKALYYAGAANAGIKVIAINLPYDPKVQAEKGTRTILLSNIMEEKFNRIVFPAGLVLIEKDQQEHLDSDAFFYMIAFREVAHGLGVKETINGKGSVTEALGSEALTIEEAKGNVVGLNLALSLVDRHDLSGILTREDLMTTFLANLLRSVRFGEGEALGRANIMVYNLLNEAGAFSRNESGKYTIDYGRMSEAVAALAGRLLEIQGNGDIDQARELTSKATSSAALRGDARNLNLENIPIDVRFEF